VYACVANVQAGVHVAKGNQAEPRAGSPAVCGVAACACGISNAVAAVRARRQVCGAVQVKGKGR